MSDRLRLYVDTSVLGGYYDAEFKENTRAFFELIRTREVEPLISDMVIVEIGRAPEPIRKLLEGLLVSGAETIEASERAVYLQKAYLDAGVLGDRWEDDAMHVAMASVGLVDALVSWNFKHLLDPRNVRGFNGVNLSNGYGMIQILSPADIVGIVEREP